MNTAFTTPLLLVPGDRVYVGPLYEGVWRPVEQVSACLIPAHGPVCTVITASGWRNLPATHHGPGSCVWAQTRL